MKFIGLQENLKKGLNISSHTTSKNINLPILNNLLIKAYSGEIEIIGTNLEIAVSSIVRGKVDSEGEFTVNSRLITDYINLLNNGEKVSFELKENELIVESGSYKTKIKGESSKEFPLIPSVDDGHSFSFDLINFKKALNNVIFAVSNSENRLELTGVFFSFNEKNLELAATDSYRLAEKSINYKSGETKGITSIIIPSKTIQELLRILNNITDEGDSVVEMVFSDNQVMFKFNSATIISRLLNGNYPDYKQIIPKNIKTNTVLNKAELLRAVKAAALFSKNGVNDIYLKVDKKGIDISSYSGSSGQSDIRVEAEVSGEKDNEITINYKYLIDGVNNIDSDTVEIGILNSNSPCVIKPTSVDDYIYIVMPIKQ